MPGMNPRQMQAMMRKMGVKQQEIDAKRLIIQCEDKNIIIENPSIQKINMMGQETLQVSGQMVEEAISLDIDITEEDIQTVVEQTECSSEEAEEAIKNANGDLAEAILTFAQK